MFVTQSCKLKPGNMFMCGTTQKQLYLYSYYEHDFFSSNKMNFMVISITDNKLLIQNINQSYVCVLH